MSKRKDKKEDANDALTRIAIVSNDKCKPKRCRQECKKFCPVVRMGMCLIPEYMWDMRIDHCLFPQLSVF